MSQIITDVFWEENVSLVTLNKFSPDISEISSLFNEMTEQSINLDMITQTISTGGLINISFTIHDEDISKTLAILKKHRTKSTSNDVNTGNVKFAFYGEKMRLTPGVAASIFALLAKENVDVELITTSEVDISILVDRSNGEIVHQLILDHLKIEPLKNNK